VCGIVLYGILAMKRLIRQVKRTKMLDCLEFILDNIVAFVWSFFDTLYK